MVSLRILKSIIPFLAVTALMLLLIFNKILWISGRNHIKDQISTGSVLSNMESSMKFMPMVEINYNPNSTIANDIIKIVHQPNQSKVNIYFSPSENRRCKEPQLIGRLSGPFISKLKWEKQLQQRNTSGRMMDVLTGWYKVPEAGRYFLEILVLMCEDPPFETYDGSTCLENPEHNRITQEGAFIDTAVEEPNRADTIGYWYNHREKVNHEPLYTRYQPQTCRGKWSNIQNKSKWESASQWEAHCQKATDLSRFDPYKFKFTYKNLTLDSIMDHLRSVGTGEGLKVCFLGASHARVLRDTSFRLLNETMVSFELVEVEFADEFDSNTAKMIIDRNCTKTVIGLGQWDAGWPRRHMTKFPAYQHALTKIAKIVNDLLHETDNNIGIYFRRTHYNPLGDMIGSCPASDWRNPVVIDRYNEITENICKTYNITFIDTKDVMSPLWDRASDWCHYNDISSESEAMYIIDTIFNAR